MTVEVRTSPAPRFVESILTTRPPGREHVTFFTEIDENGDTHVTGADGFTRHLTIIRAYALS
jgi:hypothetical protein